MRLSNAVIQKRMQEWRNLKVQNAQQNVRIAKLESESKALRAENALLRTENAQLKSDIQSLKLQLEELRTIVFGKKKKHEDTDEEETPPLSISVAQPRTSASYRRPLPKPHEITKHVRHEVERCPRGHLLTKKARRVFYTHDIPAIVVPEIIEHTVETGWCTECKRHVSAIPLPFAPVTFGHHIKRFVAVLSTVHRLSHPQIQLLLALHFHTTVSDGEIAKMLASEAEKLRAEKERLKSSIQLSSVRQIDETSWEVCLDDGKGKFCWVMSDALSSDRVYELGRSRGKGVADELLGETANATVSDDYGAYRKRTNHQLCFAHPARDFRDLASSTSIDTRTRSHCADLRKRLGRIYHEIDTHRDPALSGYFSKKLRQLTLPLMDEPKKLRTLKETFRANIPKYLTCLKDPRIPLTNNRAERDLRHVVLKRNVSFGSRNAKGAEHTGILLSCLMSRLGRGTLGDYLLGV